MPLFLHAQNNQISIKAALLDDHKILVDQDIIYYNPSDQPMDTIYLLNWANGYRDKKTPLTKRLISDYDKSLYFAKIKDRGYSKILLLQCNESNTKYKELEDASDIIRVILPVSLAPQESVKIHVTYEVKFPNDKFTRYGHDELSYNLRYWHLTPAVFDTKWHLFSNLNMDDYYMQPTDFKIDFLLPLGYTLHSELDQEVEINADQVLYKLTGKDRLDIQFNILLNNNFSMYNTESLDIITDIKSKNLTENIKVDVLQRQIDFIKEHLGTYPHQKMLINLASYQKRPVYGFNQLPKSKPRFLATYLVKRF